MSKLRKKGIISEECMSRIAEVYGFNCDKLVNTLMQIPTTVAVVFDAT